MEEVPKDLKLAGKRNKSEAEEKPKSVFERLKKNKPQKKEEEKLTPIKIEGTRMINLKQTNNNLRMKSKKERKPKYKPEPQLEPDKEEEGGKEQEGEKQDPDKIVRNKHYN